MHSNRRIGDIEVPPIGFGAMLLSLEGRPDEATALRTVHAALDGGARLIDTAINYGSSGAELGHNETLVAKALSTWSGARDDVLVVCKGGNLRTDELQFVQDASPANLRWSCETSLRLLGVETIGLYFLHAVDPKVPLADSVGALARLQEEGKIQRIGLSNVGRTQLAQAQQIVDVAAVENRLSPWAVNSLPIVKVCEAAGVAFLSYSPLGSQARAKAWDEKPGFIGVARELGVSPQQVALAWALSLSPVVLPIPSARRPETIRDSLGAMELKLSAEHLARLENDLSAG